MNENDFVDDNRLSLKAIGFLSKALRLTGFSPVKGFSLLEFFGKDSLRSALKELIGLGYCHYEKQSINGQFEYSYTFYPAVRLNPHWGEGSQNGK